MLFFKQSSLASSARPVAPVLEGRHRTFARAIASAALLAAHTASIAGGIPAAFIEEVTVVAELDRLQGAPISASQGVVVDAQLRARPILRSGEVMEVVPGLIVTQHSGAGKAVTSAMPPSLRTTVFARHPPGSSMSSLGIGGAEGAN